MDHNVELTGRVESYFEQILAQQVQVRRYCAASTFRYPIIVCVRQSQCLLPCRCAQEACSTFKGVVVRSTAG